MDRNNNIEEFLKENDSLIYSFFSGSLGEVVYIGKEQYLDKGSRETFHAFRLEYESEPKLF